MAFFNQIGAGGFQPKRKFRFLVVFPKLTNLTFMAKAAAKPSYDMSPSEHNVLNHVFKFPGIVKWEDGPTRMPENNVNTFTQQALADDFRPFEFQSSLHKIRPSPAEKARESH